MPIHQPKINNNLVEDGGRRPGYNKLMSDENISPVAKAAAVMRQQRERLGWSTGYLAREATMHARNQGDLINISQQTISAFEQGRAKKMPYWYRYIDDAFTNAGKVTDYPHIERHASKEGERSNLGPLRTIWDESGEIHPWPNRKRAQGEGKSKAGIPIFRADNIEDGSFRVPEKYRRLEGDPGFVENFDDLRVSVKRFELHASSIIGEYSRNPLGLVEARSCYGLYMPNDALGWAIPRGTPMLISRVRPAAEGDLALLYLWRSLPEASDVPDQENLVVVPALLLGQSPYWYEGAQLHEEGRHFRVSADLVPQIHRIYTISDFLG